MAGAGKKGRAPRRETVASRTSEAPVAQESEDLHDRVLRMAGAEPKPILIGGAVLFVFAVSIGGGGRYVINPNLLTGTWSYIAGALAATFTFLAMSTLMSMAYCFMFPRDTTLVRAFAASVGNFAAIGAIVGTLLGLRLVVPFGIDLVQHRADHDQPFMECISIVGSAATMVTLMMIGLCWVRSLGVLIYSIRSNVGAADSRSRTVVLIRGVLPAVIMAGANFLALNAARAMMFLVVSK
ncbi:MAG TPA: hypothetical protein VH969_23285 [Actinophytocola sp.]|jgi:hypothetical protein|uniref:hypothetical protein n=1 Tax=Actinophytocola sp. TaxID=1872138 RepID=UPI002F92C8D3